MVVGNVAEEAVPPQEVSVVQYHSTRVLSRDSSVLPGLAIHDIVPELRVGVLMARSNSLVARIVPDQVWGEFLVQVTRMEEALG